LESKVYKINIKRINLLLGAAGLGCILLALACFALLLSLRVDGLWGWYAHYQEILREAEDYIRAIRPRWLFAAAILAAFTFWSFVPLFSLTTLCLMSGVILPVYMVLPLNAVGLSITFCLPYWRGHRYGVGKAWRFILKNTPARRLLERDSARNPWLLLALRLVPGFPVNSVSRIYGEKHYPPRNYIALSLFGFAPRLFSSTFIGSNMFDPLSAAFLTPLILILLVSGLSLLFVNTIWAFIDSRH